MASDYALHPWHPGTLMTHTEHEVEPKNDQLDMNVEMPAEDWTAVTPGGPPAVRTIHFVDGARRHDALAYYKGRTCLLVIVSVGCASSTYGSPAEVAHDAPKRFVVCGCRKDETLKLPRIDIPKLGIAYEPLVTNAGTEVTHLNLAAQERMSAWEAEVALRKAMEQSQTLVVCDGPRPKVNALNVLGYLKTVTRERLGERQRRVAYTLVPGQRTPLYLVHRPHAGDLYEWVIRPREPVPANDSRLGLVRMQASAKLPLEEAVRLADWSALTLPEYSTDYYQDGRAPEQLLIIKSLENHLRRYFGNTSLLRLHLREVLHEALEVEGPLA